MSEIYLPEEDSYLMSSTLNSELSKVDNIFEIRFLEIGSGSGVNLQAAESCGVKKENIFSADINPNAVIKCKSLGFNCIESNLFSKIKGEYDLIIFNPPYLPEDKTGMESKSSRLATTGGKKGNEIILEFLKQAKKYLSKKGKIFLLTSSFTPKINFRDLGYSSKVIATKNLFFEKLFVHEIKFTRQL